MIVVYFYRLNYVGTLRLSLIMQVFLASLVPQLNPVSRLTSVSALHDLRLVSHIGLGQ